MFANWIRRLASLGAAEQSTAPAPRFRLRLEAMEDRTVPSHLGVKEVEVPAAAQALQGIEAANDRPTHETPNGAEAPHFICKPIMLRK